MMGDGHPDADRQALLALLLSEEGIELADEGIAPRDPSLPAVLSYAQERMWFLDQLETDTRALAVRVATAVHGPLDVDAYGRALDEIFARHAVLRTLVSNVAGEPVPRVLPPGPMPVAHIDVAGDEAAVAAILAAEAARTFDLEHEPPVHVTIVRVGAAHHVISVVMHHIASDGTSMGVFFAELGALYGAFRSALPSPLSPLAVQYDDYAAWQRTSAASTFARQLDYWRVQLGTDLPVFEIPPDHQRPLRHDVSGGIVVRAVPADLAAGVEALAQANSATTFMVLLAAFDVVAGRHAGQTDIVVGAPIAGRVRPQLAPMIGAFLNTIVLRTDIGDNPTFTTLVGRVRDLTLAAYDNQDVPFELLLQDLRPHRDVSRTPLFQIMVNMNRFDSHDAIGLDELRTELLEQPDVGSKFDLTLYIDDIGGTLTLRLVYNRSLYEHEHMERLVAQFVHVLDQVVAAPHVLIDDVSLVTAGDGRVLPDPTAALDASWHGSVPGAVRRIARCARDRVAVDDGDRRWTYGLLSTRMVRLASWLRVRQIGTGDVVAIYAHRSGSLIWAIAGVLASGGAYLVLDPRYPPARLASLLRIARPSAWIALEGAGPPPAAVLEELDAIGVERRLVLGNDADVAMSDLGEPPATGLGSEDDVAAAMAAIRPDHAACLTFTSGSTGVPKAVIGRHGSLTHFLPWMSAQFEVGEDDRFSMLSGLAHDPLQRDIFWPLWLGATIVVPDAASIPDPGYLAAWMRDERVSVAHLTPAMGQLLAELVDVDKTTSVPSLRRMFFIGESLTRSLVDRVARLAPAVRIVNLYGTTETQRASGFHDVGAEARAPAGVQRKEVLPIGSGMPGCQLLVRTTSGLRAAVGEIGEIVVRSPHLALGYWDDPELTASRFAVDPAGTSPADQIYATGDIGRYRADGSVEYLGRNDQQVQLRGFRVELGEVAAALRSRPDVADAIVRVQDDVAGRQRVVAYVVPAPHTSSAPLTIVRELRAVLPAHAVPSSVVMIDAMPLNPNGKVDWRALPAVGAATLAPTVDDGSPRDELERALVEIWAKVLGHRDLGIHEDFFDLGGYSLLASRLFALVEQRTGHRLPVSVLFEHPTIARLADAIRNDGWRTSWSSLVPIQVAGTRRPFFYVAPYLISVLELASLADELGTEQPLYGFEPQGLDGSRPTHTTIEEMAAHYITEMKSVQPTGPYALGGHCSGSWVAFEMARQLEEQGDSISALVLVDLGPPGVQRPRVKPLRYIASRIRHYFISGRLRRAIAWKLRVLTARHLVRRVSPTTARRESGVREAHRIAYTKYRGGRIHQDIMLVLSDDSLTLSDKAWYTKWDDVTDGQITTRHVGGTHANLLVPPFVTGLGRSVAEALAAGAFETTDANVLDR